MVITGISGAEFGIRGFIDGWDPQTGEHLWRTYTIPGPGEPGHDTWPGDTWKHGGGSTWITGSFDPELHTVYWGIGNPGPFNATGTAGRQSLHLLGAGARSQDAARSSGTSSSRRTIRTTTTRSRRWCWPR